jgi:hypothetical protein
MTSAAWTQAAVESDVGLKAADAPLPPAPTTIVRGAVAAAAVGALPLDGTHAGEIDADDEGACSCCCCLSGRAGGQALSEREGKKEDAAASADATFTHRTRSRYKRGATVIVALLAQQDIAYLSMNHSKGHKESNEAMKYQIILWSFLKVMFPK